MAKVNKDPVKFGDGHFEVEVLCSDGSLKTVGVKANTGRKTDKQYILDELTAMNLDRTRTPVTGVKGEPIP